MAWLSISFEVAASDVEAVTDALLEAGAASVDVADADAGAPAEVPVFAENGAAAPRPWARSRIGALVPENADPAILVESACRSAGVAAPPYRSERVADQDWVRASRDQFAPIRVTPRLWIVPSWHEPPDPGAVNVLLDPGLAFGTGGHPTTRLVLQWLERVLRRGDSVIDYGCGSGILAIAAMKLGAGQADAVDIDEQALLAARGNAIHNQVPISFHSAAGAIRRPARIVLANILARPLIVLAPLLARLTEPGGRLALAGLLAAQADEVRASYDSCFEFDPDEEAEGWVLLTAVRKPD